MSIWELGFQIWDLKIRNPKSQFPDRSVSLRDLDENGKDDVAGEYESLVFGFWFLAFGLRSSVFAGLQRYNQDQKPKAKTEDQRPKAKDQRPSLTNYTHPTDSETYRWECPCLSPSGTLKTPARCVADRISLPTAGRRRDRSCRRRRNLRSEVYRP